MWEEALALREKPQGEPEHGSAPTNKWIQMQDLLAVRQYSPSHCRDLGVNSIGFVSLVLRSNFKPGNDGCSSSKAVWIS